MVLLPPPCQHRPCRALTLAGGLIGRNHCTQVHMLRSLSAQELHDQLCGEEALEWSLEHLEEAVVPGAGYTRNSQVLMVHAVLMLWGLEGC